MSLAFQSSFALSWMIKLSGLWWMWMGTGQSSLCQAGLHRPCSSSVMSHSDQTLRSPSLMLWTQEILSPCSSLPPLVTLPYSGSFAKSALGHWRVLTSISSPSTLFSTSEIQEDTEFDFPHFWSRVCKQETFLGVSCNIGMELSLGQHLGTFSSYLNSGMPNMIHSSSCQV